MARAETKDRILDTSSRLFRRQGFSSTGIKQVIELSGATGGSLYHFFPDGKEQLAIATVERFGKKYERLIDEVCSAADHPADSVSRFFDMAAEALENSGFADGCPIGTIALDVASTNESIRRACAGILKSWRKRISSELVKVGVGAREADSLGEFALSALEGAILMSRVLRDTSPLRQTDLYVRRLLGDTIGNVRPPKRGATRKLRRRSGK